MDSGHETTMGFVDAKAYLRDLEVAERNAERDLMRELDWFDPEDISIWRKQKNREEREKLLNKLVPDRKCPRCSNLKAGLRSWVISKHKKSAICRSCYYTHRHSSVKRSREGLYVDVVVFERFVKYKLNGVSLRFARKKIELNQREFGDLVGWSGQHQGQLERGNRQSVMEDKMNRILSVFEEFLKNTDDEDWDILIKSIVLEEEPRYKINHEALTYVRELAGIGQAELSRQAGLQDNVLCYLESGRVKSIVLKLRENILGILSRRYKIQTKD